MTSRVASAAIRRRSAHQHHLLNGNVDSDNHNAIDDLSSNVGSSQNEFNNCGTDFGNSTETYFSPSDTSTPSRRRLRFNAVGNEAPESIGRFTVSPIEDPSGPSASTSSVGTDTSTTPNTPTMTTTPRFSAPILGYEIVEQRAKFTVFKIRVSHIPSEEGWFVFRRYTDFVRLHHKLRILFPSIRFGLPPKRWFRDNFEPAFLEERLHGLQTFVDNVLFHSGSSESLPVSEFFCLEDSPDSFYDSIEESRARCETLEDLVSTLRLELHVKRTEVELLKAELATTKTQTKTSSLSLTQSDDASFSPVLKMETDSASHSFTNKTEELFCTALDLQNVESRNSTIINSLENSPEQDQMRVHRSKSSNASMDTNGNQMVR